MRRKYKADAKKRFSYLVTALLIGFAMGLLAKLVDNPHFYLFYVFSFYLLCIHSSFPGLFSEKPDPFLGTMCACISALCIPHMV